MFVKQGFLQRLRAAVAWPALALTASLLLRVAEATSLTLTGPTATFDASHNLTGFSVTVMGASGIDLTGRIATLEYMDSGGTILGTETTRVGRGGVLTVPPPPIPGAAARLNNRVRISVDGFVGDLRLAPIVEPGGTWVGVAGQTAGRPQAFPQDQDHPQALHGHGRLLPCGGTHG